MTGVRLLVDMNLSPRWADWRGAAGISAVHRSAIGATVLAALRQTEADLQQGALLTVEPGRARNRLLPLPDGS